MNKPYEVVFQDEYLIVLNKIAKLLVQPSPKKEKYTLTSLLNKELNKRNEKALPCHRLDRETTGLIVYAKNSKIQSSLMTQFKERSVKKKYLAFVRGRIRPKQGILEGVILDKDAKRFKEKAKSARSSYRVVAELEGFSFLELKPFTGRTNQLRIQLKEAGHPILGERKYAFGKDFAVKFRRLALHAFFLRLRHPVSHHAVQFEVGLPEDMKKFLEKHRRK